MLCRKKKRECVKNCIYEIYKIVHTNLGNFRRLTLKILISFIFLTFRQIFVCIVKKKNYVKRENCTYEIYKICEILED